MMFADVIGTEPKSLWRHSTDMQVHVVQHAQGLLHEKPFNIKQLEGIVGPLSSHYTSAEPFDMSQINSIIRFELFCKPIPLLSGNSS